MTKPAELYACLYAREFPAQAMLRLRPELRGKPCIVLEGDSPSQHVCACNTKARLVGVKHNMTRVEAETFTAITMLKRSLIEEVVARGAILECLSTFSPSIEEVSEGRAFLSVLDIAGTEKLHGPPATLASALLDCVGKLGITAYVAISSNFHAAICLVRGMASGNRVTVVQRGEERIALAPLPISVLDLSEDQAETFALWGIHTLGMLAELPEKPLIARMGQTGKRLWQLAWGNLSHHFVPTEAVFTLEEFIELDSPVELLDSLLFVIGVMLEQLIGRVSGRVLALAAVTATLSLEGGLSHSLTVRPALPSNDRQLWIKLLHLELEAHAPVAAVLSLRLAAEPGQTGKIQLGLFTPQLPDAARLDVTLARIRAVVGEGFAGSPVLEDSHRPDAFRMKPFTVPGRSVAVSTFTRPMTAMRQLRPAESVSVALNEQRPFVLYFRQKRYHVERAYGPWLYEGNWWGDTSWRLQQWDLIGRSQDGVRLCACLVRDLRQNCWQVAALYD
jgi:protein ImuB